MDCERCGDTKRINKGKWRVHCPDCANNPRKTAMRVNGETWHVRRGFGSAFRRVLSNRRANASQADERLSDLLSLVGIAVSPFQIVGWTLYEKAEAEVYAINAHFRASDNVIQRYPEPAWLRALKERTMGEKIEPTTVVHGEGIKRMFVCWFDEADYYEAEHLAAQSAAQAAVAFFDGHDEDSAIVCVHEHGTAKGQAQAFRVERAIQAQELSGYVSRHVLGVQPEAT